MRWAIFGVRRTGKSAIGFTVPPYHHLETAMGGHPTGNYRLCVRRLGFTLGSIHVGMDLQLKKRLLIFVLNSTSAASNLILFQIVADEALRPASCGDIAAIP